MNRQHYNFAVLITCIALLGLAFAFKVDGNNIQILNFNWPLNCALHKHFGIKCALCGMTRAFTSIAHGHITKSFQYHPIAFFLFLFILMQIPYRIWALAIHPKKLNKKITKIAIAAAIIISVCILLNWLIYLGGHLNG